VDEPRSRNRRVSGDGQLEPEPVGSFHAWWRGDPLPRFPRWPGLTIHPVPPTVIGPLAGIGEEAAAERAGGGHQPWLARLSDEPVGWGWCADREAAIGELGLTRPIPPGNRYLWDFWTVPAWRGHGIYPRLLQAIVAHERDADRFWVGHDLGNIASARGIGKAGFQEVGLLFRQPDGGWELVPRGAEDRAAAVAEIFALPIASRLAARTA
jgi:RimJ/RimL family protein N-acetyltransferase